MRCSIGTGSAGEGEVSNETSHEKKARGNVVAVRLDGSFEGAIRCKGRVSERRRRTHVLPVVRSCSSRVGKKSCGESERARKARWKAGSVRSSTMCLLGRTGEAKRVSSNDGEGRIRWERTADDGFGSFHPASVVFERRLSLVPSSFAMVIRGGERRGMKEGREEGEGGGAVSRADSDGWGIASLGSELREVCCGGGEAGEEKERKKKRGGSGLRRSERTGRAHLGRVETRAGEATLARERVGIGNRKRRGSGRSGWRGRDSPLISRNRESTNDYKKQIKDLRRCALAGKSVPSFYWTTLAFFPPLEELSLPSLDRFAFAGAGAAPSGHSASSCARAARRIRFSPRRTMTAILFRGGRVSSFSSASSSCAAENRSILYDMQIGLGETR